MQTTHVQDQDSYVLFILYIIRFLTFLRFYYFFLNDICAMQSFMSKP